MAIREIFPSFLTIFFVVNIFWIADAKMVYYQHAYAIEQLRYLKECSDIGCESYVWLIVCIDIFNYSVWPMIGYFLAHPNKYHGERVTFSQQCS